MAVPSDVFILAAARLGHTAESARVAFSQVVAALANYELAAGASLFVFRNVESTGGDGGAKPVPPRERRIVAFASADSALAFAQRNGLGPGARLQRLRIEQLLAVMLERPSIVTLLVVDEECELPPRGTLPTGVRLERGTLVAWLESGLVQRNSDEQPLR
jgi:hypothetical protein